MRGRLAPPPPHCRHVSATARLDAAASPDGAVRRCKNCSIHSRLLPRWGQGGAEETTACSSSTKAGERVRERGARFHKGRRGSRGHRRPVTGRTAGAFSGALARSVRRLLISRDRFTIKFQTPPPEQFPRNCVEHQAWREAQGLTRADGSQRCCYSSSRDSTRPCQAVPRSQFGDISRIRPSDS